MPLRRKQINISLIILSLLLGGWAACLYRRPPLVLNPTVKISMSESPANDSTVALCQPETLETQPSVIAEPAVTEPKVTSARERMSSRVESTRFSDFEPHSLSTDHPFRQEAMKVINGHLEETDSLSRHKILSYCEHLRTSYTTRDIDFLRQVFSDNALIIVGHVVKTGDSAGSAMALNPGVKYNVRSKHEYLDRLTKIFNSGKDIDVTFSDFMIMRHPTVKGIYGVTLRQQYSCGSYDDDGYLFLLWDFRDMSMPLIHVRTWQPTLSINLGNDELIDISDFNLE